MFLLIKVKFLRYQEIKMALMKTKAVLIQIFILMGILIISSENLISYSEDSLSNQTMNKNNNMTRDISDLIFDLDSHPFNITYSDWTSKWWEWAYSIPKDIHPAYDDTGKFCQVGQEEPVWFFAGTFEHSVIRYCEIPGNVGLLFPVLNSECSFAEYPEMKTKEELSDCAKKIQDTTVPAFVTIDGVEIPSLKNYRIQSHVFNFTLPKENILDLPEGNTQSVSDGNWMFLKPFPPGDHELKFKGNIKPIDNRTKEVGTVNEEFAGPIGWNYTTTYLLTVK